MIDERAKTIRELSTSDKAKTKEITITNKVEVTDFNRGLKSDYTVVDGFSKPFRGYLFANQRSQEGPKSFHGKH